MSRSQGKGLSRRVRAMFGRAHRRSRALTGAPQEALMTVDKALAKAEGRAGASSRLRAAFADLGTLGRLVRAWFRRDYRQVSPSTIVMALAALVYFLAPLDAIFDAVPVLGFIDDATVIAWVISEIRAELSQFRTWEDTHALAAAEPPALTPVG